MSKLPVFIPGPVFFRLFFLIGFCGLGLVPTLSAEESGVQVPKGFQATIYADDDIAPNIYCMTIDSQGRVVVSGPGYVRILIDADGDGKAESFKQFADGPRTGAQGMFFHGTDLLCVGDQGLLRYRDRDGDDRADGPPQVFLNLKTGGEHHSHSIQRGPDGWWYLISGNFAGIDQNYVTLKSSPVLIPQAGTLMRLKPDLSGGEIFADGFRNAYDFTFGPNGEIFTYDSDGERDVSLPWYLPTRVFHVLPGSHAGWISRSWKRPDHFLDMPPVVGSFGRGSPTGVICYQHTQFPERYRNALFVLDWTFGRVIALPLTESGSSVESTPFNFMTGVGQYGFAPTDIEVGADGSLYVSVGGRGTRGGVFRVQFPERLSQIQPPATIPTEPNARLLHCLTIPQPQSSWSRAIWVPLAKELGKNAFLQAAINPKLDSSAQVRAIEICTELFDGLDNQMLTALHSAESPEVRARAIWSAGRTRLEDFPLEVVGTYLFDPHPLVVRSALDALLGTAPSLNLEPLFPALGTALGSTDPFVRQAAIRVLSRIPSDKQQSLRELVQKLSPQALLSQTIAAATPPGPEGLDRESIAVGLLLLSGDYPNSLRLQACRMLQMILGDVGPAEKRAPVFDGYAPQMDLGPHDQALDPLRIELAKVFPTGEPLLDFEVARLISMVQVPNPKILEGVLAKLTSESHPVEDIHYLIVASRIAVARSASQRESIARALVSLEAKIHARKLNQDNNWEDRIRELYHQLVEQDYPLPGAIVRDPGFGRPGHVLFMSELASADLPLGIEAFVRQIQADDEYPWSTDVIFVLGESDDPEHRQMIRDQFTNFGVRNAVLMVLAEQPQELDHSRFLEGLDTADLKALAACLHALEQLPLAQSPHEMLALYRTTRRLGEEPEEFPLRDRAMKLLQASAGQNFGYVFGPDGHKPQPQVMETWASWLSEQFPIQTLTELGGGETDLKQLAELLDAADWGNGDPERGHRLFEQRACARCHGGRNAVGPDLAGVTRRFSRKDLFTAIAVPNRDVSSRYQTILIQTTSGRVISGMIVYESVDGLLLRDANQQAYRVEANEIEMRRILRSSLMPEGLLKDLTASDLADLYAWLESLGNSSTE